MASEFRRRTLLTWGVIGAGGYGLEHVTHFEERDAEASAEKRGKRWHRQPIEAFALSPDGRFIATGSRSMSDSLSDLSDAVVMWSVDQASGLLQVPLAGGVKRVDAPFTALAFSPDGSKLGALTRRNEVSVIEVSSGLVSGHHGLRAIEQSPRFFFSQNGEQLFVAATALPGSIGEVADARGSSAGRPVRFEDAEAVPFRLDERGLHVVSRGEYRIIPPDGPPTTVATLLAGQVQSVAIDVPRSHLAMAVAGKLLTIDLETGQVKAGEGGDATSLWMSAGAVPLGLSRTSEGWQAYRYDEALAQQALFASDDVAVEMMADAQPAALSPDAAHAIELRGNGEVQVWSLAGPRAKLLGSLGVFKRARGVVWPRENRAVVFGPQLLAFCEPLTRLALAPYEFPRF